MCVSVCLCVVYSVPLVPSIPSHRVSCVFLSLHPCSFLGLIDLHGTSFEDTTIATGYGAYIARPLLRKAYRDDMTQEEAMKAVEDAMRVMYYRDARTINKVQFAVATADGITISEPKEIDTTWYHFSLSLS
jgi:20S proteasome alpha/beta subunit